MDKALDGVAVVIDDKYYRLQTLANHGADLLDGKLERAVAYEEDRAIARRGIRGGERGSLSCADGIADGSPEDLRDGGHTSWEFSIPDAEVGGTGLGYCKESVRLVQ